MSITLVVLFLGVVGVAFALSRTPKTEYEDLDPPDEVEITSEPKTSVISAKQFKARLMSEIVDRDETSNVVDIDPGSFSIELNGMEAVVVSIGNMYSSYREEPSSLDHHICMNADMAMEAVADAKGFKRDASIDQLAVVLRHKDYLDYVDKDETLWRPFIGDLIAIMVLYYPEYLLTVALEHIDQLQIGVAEAWAQATENLRTQFQESKIVAERQGVKVFDADSGLATGHLWLSCTQLGTQDFFAMVINKESYIFADMSDQIAIQTLADIAGNFILEGNTLSDNIVCVQGRHLYALRMEGNRWFPIEA